MVQKPQRFLSSLDKGVWRLNIDFAEDDHALTGKDLQGFSVFLDNINQDGEEGRFVVVRRRDDGLYDVSVNGEPEEPQSLKEVLYGLDNIAQKASTITHDYGPFDARGETNPDNHKDRAGSFDRDMDKNSFMNNIAVNNGFCGISQIRGTLPKMQEHFRTQNIPQKAKEAVVALLENLGRSDPRAIDVKKDGEAHAYLVEDRQIRGLDMYDVLDRFCEDHGMPDEIKKDLREALGSAPYISGNTLANDESRTRAVGLAMYEHFKELETIETQYMRKADALVKTPCYDGEVVSGYAALLKITARGLEQTQAVQCNTAFKAEYKTDPFRGLDLVSQNR